MKKDNVKEGYIVTHLHQGRPLKAPVMYVLTSHCLCYGGFSLGFDEITEVAKPKEGDIYTSSLKTRDCLSTKTHQYSNKKWTVVDTTIEYN